MSRRLFIISNRLPLTIENEADKILAKPSAGGLVTAISSYLDKGNKDNKDFAEVFWAGAPGCSTSVWTEAERKIARSQYTYLPVFLGEEEYDCYYNGFANSVIWPLFHYFPSYADYNADHYRHYINVNNGFAEAVLRYARPNDIIWIHDYHLLPLANMLRKALPGLTIGFFLHIPFPSYELFRLLPKKWQEELMQGLLGADLIGFHTIDYATHFLQSVQMILGVEHDMNMIRYKNRLIKADVFPISIDYEKFNSAYDVIGVKSVRETLIEKFKGKKIIFSVDRLDYTKGVSNRLKSYSLFLSLNPSYREKVVFIMVIVPSREFINKYAERKKMIDETISNINSKQGNIHWQPIIYQYNTLTFEQMVGLYTACDLALITPLRDGMNLVAKEFVASRKDQQGALLLSEMAGAARELTTAITINPNDIEEMAEKIRSAFEMPGAEQTERMAVMQQRIALYNVQVWADDFLKQLNTIKQKQKHFQVKFLDADSKRFLMDKFCQANNRLLLLDYDGTLVHYASMPKDARPDREVMELLEELTSAGKNHVFIVSGRDSNTLEKWLGHLPLNMIAEHGAKMKLNGKEWKDQLFVEHDWKPFVDKIMQGYVQRCAHTFIEIKQFSMVWHFRNANMEEGRLRSLELFSELTEYTYNLGVQVLMGNKIVEVRVNGVDKGSIIKKEILNETYDFIMAIGDDKTDEDMFKILAPMTHAHTIKIGSGASFAKYNLHNPQMVRSLLSHLLHLSALKFN